MTTGHQLDPDGYTLHVDTLTRSLPDSGSAFITGLTPGNVQVQVTGIASNCGAVGSATQEVHVVADSTTNASLAVTCDTTYGGLKVVLATTGGAPDSNGYLVKVDSGAATRVPDSDSLIVRPLSAGSHTLRVTDAASNCAVAGGVSRSVAIVAGQDTTVNIGVSCPAPGFLKLLISTTGGTPDSNGYLVKVDASAPVRVADADSLVIQPLSVGSHGLTITDVASNCSVGGGASRSVQIGDGQDTTISIPVSCPTPTTVTVHATTTGTYLDPDGYSVSVDGGSPVPLSDSGSTAPIPVTPGSHTIHIGGVVMNCAVTGGVAQPVSAAADTNTGLSVSVTCTPPPIVFADDTIVGNNSWVSLFLVNPDGSNRTRLTGDSVTNALRPRWSPDGSSVLFTTNGAGGQYAPALVAPVTHAAHALPYAAKPFLGLSWLDGGHLVGSYFNNTPPALPHEVAIIDTTGGGFQQVTFDTTPAGATDTTVPGTFRVDYTPTGGGRIAFERNWCVESVCHVRLWTQPTAVAPGATVTDTSYDATGPAWSPDGSQIAFTRGGDIYVMHDDGSNQTQLTQGGGLVRARPRWSAAGDQIVYDACGAVACGIYRVVVATEVEVQVTPYAQGLTFDNEPDWRWAP